MSTNSHNRKVDTNRAEIQEIIQGIFDFKVIPFFGSGMSARFGIKTWGSLIDEIKSDLNTPTTDYLDVAQEYQDKFGRDALIRKINTETDVVFKEENLGVHYEILAMNPPIVYTTNWDRAIETAALNIKRKYFKISCLKDITEAPHYSNVIVKFHGDFDNPENIVFTRSDYQHRLAIQHPLDVIFRAHLLGKKVLFLGYSFSDENIDFIFTKHQELYGTDLLPKSYIVAFKNNFNKERSEALKQKNIVTLVLDSVTELESLIRELNSSVFKKDIQRQTKDIFKSYPQQVLLKTDLSDLREFMFSNSHTSQQKADRFREVIELKKMSSEVELEVVSLLTQLINTEVELEIRSAIVHSFHHISFNDFSNAFNVAIELISFTKYEELNYNLQEMSMTDVMSEIESRLTPKPTCLAIFLFLYKAIETKEQLVEKQLMRIFDMLHDCRWEEIGIASDKFTKEMQDQIIQHYTRQFPSLEKQLKKTSIFGMRATRSEMAKQMEQMFPKNMLGQSPEE